LPSAQDQQRRRVPPVQPAPGTLRENVRRNQSAGYSNHSHCLQNICQ
jgi:hypothetical protein